MGDKPVLWAISKAYGRYISTMGDKKDRMGDISVDINHHGKLSIIGS